MTSSQIDHREASAEMSAPAVSEAFNRLSREIAELPDRAKVASRYGFELARSLSDADRTKAVDLISAAFQRGGGTNPELLTDEIPSLSRRDAGRVLTAFTMSIALLAQNAVTAEEFLNAARGNIFEPESEATASSVADFLVSRRSALGTALARQRLAGVVLPSFSRLEITVDLRLRFEDDEVKESVPVAIAYIDTDAINAELWFQLTRSDVELLLAKLSDCVKQMALAEELLKK